MVWLIVTLLVLTLLSIFLFPNDFLVTIYARYFFGIVFTLYLPGFALIKTLYPIHLPLETRSITLNTIERIALSLGLSLVVTPLIGSVLYYTPLGLDFVAITLCSFAVTFFFATLAVLREYLARKKQFFRKYRKNVAYFNA